MKPFREHRIRNRQDVRLLSIGSATGFEIINLDQIAYLSSDSSYTIFHLLDDREITSTRNLRYFEKRLEEFWFLRIHHQHIVPVPKIYRYLKSKQQIILVNKKTLPVSRTRRNSLLSLLKQLS